VGHQTGDRAGKNDKNDGNQGKNQADGGESGVAQVMGLLSAPVQMFLEDWNEGGGDGTDDKKLEDGVRENEGGEVNVKVALEATEETGGEEMIPDQPKHS